MKFAAWLICWPILGIFGALAFVTDAMIDACELTNNVLERIEDYVDSP
jgi:hypothetical protein